MAKKLQMCGTESEMRDVAARICRNYLHGAWKTVKPEELEFKRISGGLSNFLYYLALPEAARRVPDSPEARESSPEQEKDPKSLVGRFLRRGLSRTNSTSCEEPRKVLLRIYGQVHGERAMDAIVTESVIFTLLSERKLGPKLHGVFSGGRIEEYIPARALLTKELAEPAMSMKIAEKMAAIHSMDVPLSKEPNWLWKTMGKWLKTVLEERLTQSELKNETEELMVKKLKRVDFEKEVEWLKKYIDTIDSPVVFCHNDMQEGNILLLEDVVQTNSDDDIHSDYVQAYDEHSSDANGKTEEKSSKENHVKPTKLSPTSYVDAFRLQYNYEDANTSDSMSSRVSDNGEPKLVLIDFEYCAYNYRGFDISNHFQEWGYDYTNPEYPFYYELPDSCPTLEQKEIYIKQYLKHYLHNISEEKDQDCTPSIEDINQLLSEVDAFALASHLLWSLWSTVNATKSKIPFGYWEYAVSRLETYFRLKQEIVKKDKYGYPQKRKICEVDI